MADPTTGWLMPHKHDHNQHLAHFMEFDHGHSATHDIHTCHFSRAKLLFIDPKMSNGTWDFKPAMIQTATSTLQRIIGPPSAVLPTLNQSRRLSPTARSTVMFHGATGNGILPSQLRLMKFEVRGEGCPSSAKRPLRENVF